MQIDLNFNEGKMKSMSEAVRVVMKSYPIGHRYHGNQLHDDVSLLFPKAREMYTDTVQRAMRRFCGHQYKTIDHNKSLYERI